MHNLLPILKLITYILEVPQGYYCNCLEVDLGRKGKAPVLVHRDPRSQQGDI